MSKSFEEFAEGVKREWTDDQRGAYQAAAQAFDSERRSHVALGASLAARRNALHITQPRLAELAGVQQSEISRIERGVGNPTLSTMERLTSVLGVELTLVAKASSSEAQHTHA